jgi:hypothetical protein
MPEAAMRDLLETRMFRLHWGNKHASEQKTKSGESGIVGANETALEERFSAIIGEITDGGWEIKASLPVTASEFSMQLTPATKTAAAYATSFAAPFTDGVVLLCQRRRYVDEETYAAITSARSERQERLQRERRDAFLREHPITEKRKLIGGRTYVFRGQDFTSREAAEEAQSVALDNL